VTLASRTYNNSTAAPSTAPCCTACCPAGAMDSVSLASSESTATYADKNVGTPSW
jgi:hypothetical protein